MFGLGKPGYNTSMKVAIDSGPLTSGDAVRGIGTYTRELIQALNEKTPLRPTSREAPRDFAGQAKGSIRQTQGKLKIEVVDFKSADLSGYDLLHFPYFHPYFLTLPFSKKNKWVITIHDLIPLIYPEHFPPGLKGKIKFLIQRLSLGKVEGIIAVSETTKKDIVRLLGVPGQKIEVIYEAPREIFKKMEIGNWKLETKKRYGLPERFVLYVGDVNYNKNILALADACKIAKVSLVIVGKQAASSDIDFAHVENRPFAVFLEKYGEDPGIIRLGYVSDSDLVAIYNLATVYCQPSFYEGFGLPILEAFACGCPVVASRTQALVEIGEGAALFADPLDPKVIAEKISHLCEDSELRATLIRKGWQRVKDFSWTKISKETIAFYRKILNA